MMRAGPRLLLALLASLALAACVRAPVESAQGDDRGAIEERLRGDIAMLASDAFMGRKPGTPGEEKTLAYLETRMGEVGLLSGTGDPGSYWRQPVNLVATTPLTGELTLIQGRKRVTVPQSDAVVITKRRRALATSGPGTGVPVVFVGYGDGSVLGDALAGAVAVMLADPGRDAARRDALFAQRATAVVTVEPTADDLPRVQTAPRFELASEEVDTLAAYVTDAAIADVIGPRRWARLKADAQAADFSPIELNFAVAIEATADRQEIISHNLVGKIPGTAPGSGAVLLLAHWDHLGECGAPDATDRICNGAVDNASGLAVMLELARQLKSGPPLERDIYVLATTAEEAGLLGARAFVRDPPLPLTNIVAAFNFDMLALAPKGSPVGFIGRGQMSTLDDVILAEIARSGRVEGDRALADSFIRRQDGWVFQQQGVPTVLLSGSYGSRGVLQPFLSSRYHQPSDELGAIDLGGAVDDLLLHERLIRQIADPARYPPPAAAAP
ncbi:MAG TPA: M20/M25/M40 family metallo-hydrolase [Erythrobacter sp.]|nr:M20/M25/M40 family metallo-hydrolase [Erythrobacter sp.]